jgi:two-component system nitrate/nitrite response regulator NarL
VTEAAEFRGRVVVVADHLLVADVVVIALTNHGFDATSVDLAEAGPLSAALAAILEDPPHVLLLDVDLGSRPEETLYIAPMVRAGVDVVVMTGSHSDAARALDAGARRLIPKTSPLADLIETLTSLVPGDPRRPTPV